MHLSQDHIAYIIKDLNYRGIVAEEVQDELVDHVCSATEKEMEGGKRFIDAYHTVLKSFGHTSGLRETQKQVIQIENKKPKGMLKNYFTVAFRNLRKQGVYSFINITGLSLGVAVCLIIVLFVLNEKSYDTFNTKAERIYRIHSDIKFGGNEFDIVFGPPPMAATLVADYPEVEAAVRFRQAGTFLVKRTTENIKEQNVIWADKDFFKIFSVPVLAGNAEKALAEPNTIAVSRRVAEKFFPNEEALNQTLILDNEITAKITAVYENMPTNSHFHFDILISMEGNEEAKSPIWFSNNFHTYILLRQGANAKDFEAKLPNLVAKYVMPQAAQLLGGDFTPEKFKAAGNRMNYTLQPLLDIHLKSSLMGEFEANFDITYVYLFTAIAGFILIIACINFMNMSTARSANRAKEVGIRKVMGSFRSHLMRQFLTESTVLSLLSFVLAVVLAVLMLPLFNRLAGRELTIPFADWRFYTSLLAGALAVGILAGTYPSFFLSAFTPASVLKGNVARGMKSGAIRSALVVFQFMISIALVIGTMAIIRQLQYIQNKNLGFNKDQIIMIDDLYALGNQRLAFKEAVMQNPQVVSGTLSGYLPVTGTWRSDTPWWAEGKDATQENMVSLQNWAVDYDYVSTLNMKVVAGRDFSLDFPSDSTAVLLSESAAKAFNFSGDPVGSKIVSYGDGANGQPDRENLKSLTVVGIVENFHFESLKQNISPVMMFMTKRPGGIGAFKFKTENAQEVVQFIEKKWRELAPGQPFTYYFMDERFNNMYAAEMRLGKVIGVLAGLAVFIACLGLFALTAFTAEQRTKEIGIRKVLGASVASIMLMLSKDFGKLVVIAFVLAAPLAWYGIDWWLKDYTYKTNIGLGLYVISGLVAFLIAWATMSWLSFKAASSDPVKSLRSE